MWWSTLSGQVLIESTTTISPKDPPGSELSAIYTKRDVPRTELEATYIAMDRYRSEMFDRFIDMREDLIAVSTPTEWNHIAHKLNVMFK